MQKVSKAINVVQQQKFWRLDNWRMWVFGIVLPIVVFFPLYRYVKKQMEKNKMVEDDIVKNRKFLENQNPIVQGTKANKITTRKDIQAAAQNLAHHLGTKYSDTGSWTDVFNWRGWTENDKEVADILIKQRLNFKILERLYYDVYTNSRSLRDDVLKLLDSDELKRVSKYLKI